MTIAEQVLAAWNNRTKTFPVHRLAQRIDPGVTWDVVYEPYCVTYIFSDYTLLFTWGRGRNFAIRAADLRDDKLKQELAR